MLITLSKSVKRKDLTAQPKGFLIRGAKNICFGFSSLLDNFLLGQFSNLQFCLSLPENFLMSFFKD